MNFFKDFLKENRLYKEVFLLCNLLILFFIGLFISTDIALVIGLFFVIVLSLITFYILFKFCINDKRIVIIFIIGFLIHLCAVIFISYTGFRPFGGGADFEGYNQTAIEISNRFIHGNFSFDGLYAEHYFPILIGIIYMFTYPDMIVGQLFTVWLSAVSILLIYLTVIEVGGSKNLAFLVGLISAIYPSYVCFGSLLLKDTVIIPLVFLSLLLSIKIIKNFNWKNFIIFFIILTSLINVRFYIGYAIMFSFIISWFLLSSFNMSRRIKYGFIIILILGFSPMILGTGYYGLNNYVKLLNPERITFYREVAYSVPLATIEEEKVIIDSVPSKDKADVTPSSDKVESDASLEISIKPNLENKDVLGNGSNFQIETGLSQGPIKFVGNYLKSFTYSLLGPLPWQIRYKRQVVALFETIPWYLFIMLFIYFSINFIIKNGIKKYYINYKFSLPLIIFSVLSLGALSLFINNFGIISRIRIPIFISFLVAMSVVFNNAVDICYYKLLNLIKVWQNI